MLQIVYINSPTQHKTNTHLIKYANYNLPNITMAKKTARDTSDKTKQS